MGFTIIETNKGYKYKDKNYKWGEGLIEFVNSDFSDFIKLVDEIDSYYYNKMEATNFTKTRTYINKFYAPILNYNSNSLHINLLKDYLLEFFDIYDPGDEILKLKAHKISTLQFNLQWNFKIPLKNKQADYKSIIKDYSMNSNKQISKNSIHRLEHYISKEKEFPYMKKSIKEIKKNGNIEYETTFYIIEEFCKYEFFKVLENNITIVQCHNCNKYFISEHRNKEYCSTKCRKQYNSQQAKNDPYRSTYNEKTKKIRNYCCYYGIKEKKRKQLLAPFKEIFDRYKQPIGAPLKEENFKKFQNELDYKILEFNNRYKMKVDN